MYIASLQHANMPLHTIYTASQTRDLAVASMARDDPPTSSTAAMLLAAWWPQCAIKWDRNLKPKLAITPMHFHHRQMDRQMDSDITSRAKNVTGLAWYNFYIYEQ